MILTLALSLLGGVLSIIVLYFFWRKGEFRDVEDIKYQIFRDE